MIFVSVGHQTPFDRLVMAMDEWAAKHPNQEVFAQIGEGDYIPRHMAQSRWLSATEFDEKLAECSSMVAHAGTGTILKVLLLGKPILVMPRFAALGETRNDHQIGTARHFAEAGLVLVADDEQAMLSMVPRLAEWRPAGGISQWAQPALIDRLSRFVESA